MLSFFKTLPLFLAPMQDITTLAFMRVMAKCGGADAYVTEYFRVHEHSRLNPEILRSITQNPTGKPIYAQMIGQDQSALVRHAKELQAYPIAGVDLNLGCPAPVVCKKDAGGGLLRNPEKIKRLIFALRDACGQSSLSIKTRIGYHHPDEFQGLLDLFSELPIDFLTIHGRTVKERYQTPVHTEEVALAVQSLPYPIIANGNIINESTASGYLSRTQAAGLMIGRGAIRYPWIFQSIRAQQLKKSYAQKTNQELLSYIRHLFEETAQEKTDYQERKHVQRMKKFLNYITQGYPLSFEHEIRRASTKQEFFSICCTYLDNGDSIPLFPSENSRLFCGFKTLL